MEELGAPDAAAFKAIDADGDGRISFAEAADHKLKSLSAFATDADGRYSYDEIRRYDASR
jgi:Ca2+-binding EF-hand superfamily protein